jgi:hypothetical protein
MTHETDRDLKLPDRFQNTHHIAMHQSGIFRIGPLKKIGKFKTCFFPNQNFHINQKYYSKNGSKKLRGIKNMCKEVLASGNDEFSSLTEFGHHEIDLYPKVTKTPHFSILRHWPNETCGIWVSKGLK